MHAARAHLRVVAEPELHVPVPLSVLERAVADAGSIADDLLAGIVAAERRQWADSRAGAINELNRLALRVETFRGAFAALIAPERPTKPRRAA